MWQVQEFRHVTVSKGFFNDFFDVIRQK